MQLLARRSCITRLWVVTSSRCLNVIWSSSTPLPSSCETRLATTQPPSLRRAAVARLLSAHIPTSNVSRKKSQATRKSSPHDAHATRNTQHNTTQTRTHHAPRTAHHTTRTNPRRIKHHARVTMYSTLNKTFPDSTHIKPSAIRCTSSSIDNGTPHSATPCE